MTILELSKEDRQLLQSQGITEEMLRWQLERFTKGPVYLYLERPCTIGDGIERIPENLQEKYAEQYEEAASDGRLMKFVPASGAASRMFQFLFKAMEVPEEDLQRAVNLRNALYEDFVTFITNARRFAFWQDWKKCMMAHGRDLELCLQEGYYHEALRWLLSDKGLGYGTLPKALIKFHRYGTESRTAFEEHLVEAAHYVRDADNACRIHFTVAEQHHSKFMELLQNVRRSYERAFNCCLKVGFSYQKPSTNTIAVDMENKPLRDELGKLILRPAGHGALLDNLNELGGDLVYIKNIDNVVPDHLKGESIRWKKILGGFLVDLQQTIRQYIRDLKTNPNSQLADEAFEFARKRLHLSLPGYTHLGSLEARCKLLLNRLDRPVRVCGMVPNVGEPGGGPFWVRGEEGSLSLQIVEKAQVRLSDPEQEKVWKSSTHFNPVDLVCGLRDFKGRPYELKRYSDPKAIIITTKYKYGKEIKALELPGLWNGSMADWITIFVEVPKITFNPVKTVNDLLRKEHQPA